MVDGKRARTTSTRTRRPRKTSAEIQAGKILAQISYKLDQESERPCRAGEVFVPRPGSRPPCFDKFTGRGFELEIRAGVALCICRTAP